MTVKSHLEQRVLLLERDLKYAQQQLAALRNAPAEAIDQIIRLAETKPAVSASEPYPTAGNVVPIVFLDEKHSGPGSTAELNPRSADRQAYACTTDGSLPKKNTKVLVYRYAGQWFIVPGSSQSEQDSWVTIRIHNTTPYTLKQWETCQIYSLTNWQDTSPDHKLFPPAGLIDRTFEAVGGGLLMPQAAPPQLTPWHNGYYNDCSMWHVIVRADIEPGEIGIGIIKGCAPGRLAGSAMHFVEPTFDTDSYGNRQHGWRDASIGLSSTRSIVRYRWIAADGQAWGMIELNQAQDPEWVMGGSTISPTFTTSGTQQIVPFWESTANTASWNSHPFWRPSGAVLGAGYAGGISFSVRFNAVLDLYLIGHRAWCVQGGDSIAFAPPALPAGYEWATSQRYQWSIHQYIGFNEANVIIIDPMLYFEERIQRTGSQNPTGSPLFGNPQDSTNDKRVLRVRVPIASVAPSNNTLPETILLKARWSNMLAHYSFSNTAAAYANASIRIRNFGAYPADQNQNYIRPTWYVPGGNSSDPPLPDPHGDDEAPIAPLLAPPIPPSGDPKSTEPIDA